jgi:hypothetical protein
VECRTLFFLSEKKYLAEGGKNSKELWTSKNLIGQNETLTLFIFSFSHCFLLFLIILPLMKMFFSSNFSSFDFERSC